MGTKTNNIISKTFSYPLPDDYLYQTNTQNKTGTFTYNGPDKVWVFVNNETGKLNSGLHYTEKDDGEDIPTPIGSTKVCLTAENDPELLSIVWLGDNDYSTLPQKVENLPDGAVYARPDPTPPDHTYELMECEYDFATKTWKKPFPWKKPHMSWDELRAARRGLLEESDNILATKILSDELKAELQVYRQKLRDMPDTFDGIDPWKVPFPEMPNGAR